MKAYFDLAVIVPLEEELIQFQGVFDSLENHSLQTMLRYSFNTGAKGISGIVVQQEGMGKTDSFRATHKVIEDFDVGIVVCLGIAGGLSNDTHIGDVCYSERIIDVYDNTKFTEKTKGKIKIEFSPNYYKTDQRIVSALNFSRTLPELREKYLAWQKSRLKSAKKLIPNPYTGRASQESVSAPNTMSGKIVCAAVSKSPEYNSEILKIERKILGPVLI
jgi:nucleoside phosphorylase